MDTLDTKDEMAPHPRQPEQEGSRLLCMLPVEMILDISDHLPSPADAVCLALACKKLFRILSRRNIKKLDHFGKALLLTRLEGEIPWVVYSHRLHKLVSFGHEGGDYCLKPDDHWSYREFHGLQVPEALFDHVGRTSTRGRSSPKSLDPVETRLVRNHRLFGPDHGIPLSFLAFTAFQIKPSTFLDLVCQTFVETSRKLKWHGEDLYVSCSLKIHVVNRELTSRSISGKEIASMWDGRLGFIRVCSHCTLMSEPWSREKGLFTPQLESIESELSAEKSSTYRGRGHCFACDTDWDFSVSWAPRGLILEVTTYHDLGCCSWPADPKWIRHTEYWGRAPGVRETPCGGVRAGWSL